MKRIAVYCRVSTEEQAEKNISIPAQQSRITSYCHSKGWKVVEYYIDDGYSGKDLNRPAMQKLIEDCKQDKFDAVAVWKLDRLSRRQRDALQIIEDVFGLNPDSSIKVDKKTDLVSVTESIDTSTPMGRAQLGIIFIFAQLERETIIERSRFGKKEAAQQGRFGGGLPYGYDYDKATKQLVINPMQAEAVKLAFEYYLTGKYGFNTIAQMLTEKGFKGQQTSYMQKDQVKNILTSPFVAGYIKHLGSIYQGKHSAIIDKSVWDTVQDMINKRYVPIPVKDDLNLLTGIIYCGKCGSRMRFKSRHWSSKNSSGTNYYYVCYGRAGYKTMSDGYCSSPFYHAESINKKVIDKLKDYNVNQQEVDEVLGAIQSSSTNTDFETLKKELSHIDTQMERWLNAYEQGAINATTLSDRTKKLTDRKTKLENTIQECAEQEQAHNDRIIRATAMLEELQELPDIWHMLTIEQRRGLITNIIDCVTVYPDGEVAVKLDV